MINHHISNLISRLNNGGSTPSKQCKIINTKDNLTVLKKLEMEGYIKIKEINSSLVLVDIKILTSIKVVSTPGRRIYRKWKQLYSGFNYTYLIRTSKGIFTTSEAISLKLGGEILLKIF